MDLSVMASSEAVVCSPVASRASSSRLSGLSLTCLARPIRPSVTPDMAETMTTTSWPCSYVRTTRRATFWMRSRLATDVPPYFWTISPMRSSVPVGRADARAWITLSGREGPVSPSPLANSTAACPYACRHNRRVSASAISKRISSRSDSGPGGQSLGPLDGGHALAAEHVGQPEVVQVRARIKRYRSRWKSGRRAGYSLTRVKLGLVT